MRLLSKAFQTPQSSTNKNKNSKIKGNTLEDKKNNENENNKIDIGKRVEEDEINIDKNEYNYEVRNIDILDGWDEW